MASHAPRSQPAESGRTYRSHNQPACFPCRRRKSRCKAQVLGAPCDMCHVHGTECQWPSSEQSWASQDWSGDASPRKRVRRDAQRTPSADVAATSTRPRIGTNHTEPAVAQLVSPRPPLRDSASANLPDISHNIVQDPGTLSDEEDHNAHVIGPVMANDTKILEAYLSTMSEEYRGRKVQTASGRQARPAMFTTMSKKPLGTRQYQSLAYCKCELVEKLLGIFAQDVVVRSVRDLPGPQKLSLGTNSRQISGLC